MRGDQAATRHSNCGVPAVMLFFTWPSLVEEIPGFHRTHYNGHGPLQYFELLNITIDGQLATITEEDFAHSSWFTFFMLRVFLIKNLGGMFLARFSTCATIGGDGGSLETKGFSFPSFATGRLTIQAGMGSSRREEQSALLTLMAYGSAPVHSG
jgi:hypothetical protein